MDTLHFLIFDFYSYVCEYRELEMQWPLTVYVKVIGKENLISQSMIPFVKYTVAEDT